MGRKEILPERLQYLQPFREFLAKISKVELGNVTDTTLLEDLIHQRIQGKTKDEAQAILSADIRELEGYLSVPHRRDDKLHFAVGFLLIAAENPEQLLRPRDKSGLEKDRLVMDLPPRAKSKVDEYSLSIKWKRQDFFAQRCNMDDAFSREAILIEFAHPDASEYERLILLGKPALAELIPFGARQARRQAIKVELDPVTGHKFVGSDDFPTPWKRVDYLLKTPGGYVTVNIQANHLFEEAEWNPYLKTLRFSAHSDSVD